MSYIIQFSRSSGSECSAALSSSPLGWARSTPGPRGVEGFLGLRVWGARVSGVGFILEFGVILTFLCSPGLFVLFSALGLRGVVPEAFAQYVLKPQIQPRDSQTPERFGALALGPKPQLLLWFRV